jgi:type IV pilus assembly protein PilQ
MLLSFLSQEKLHLKKFIPCYSIFKVLKKILKYVLLLLLLAINSALYAQDDRLKKIETQLDELSKTTTPGLKEVVDFSVSGVSIQEFLRGIAETNSLNISIDPGLNIKVVNNFTNEKVASILLFLCKEYSLDIDFVGSIMSFHKFEPVKAPEIKPVTKEIAISFNAYNDLLSLDLHNDTLSKVTKKITQLTKKNLILASGLTTKIVTVYIENMPFDNAIDKMAFVNNLKLIKTKDNFYLLESAENTSNNNAGNNNSYATTTAGSKKNYLSSGSQTSSVDNLNMEVFPDTVKGNHKVSIDAQNVPIADIIKAAAKDLKINFFMFSDPKGNTTSKIQKASFEDMLSYLLQGTEHTFKKEGNVYLIGERGLEGLRTSKVIQLQHRSAEIILENIPADLKKGVDLKYFKELNALIISGSEIRAAEIEAFVKQLDKVVPMITIEVIIVNVTKSRSLKTGIAAGLDSTKKTSGNIFPGVDFTFSSKSVNSLLTTLDQNNIFNLGRVTPNFYASLSAVEGQGDVNVQSTPKLSTLNGHEANLKIGNTKYYEQPTQNTIGSLTTSVVRTVQYVSVQANLTIKINPTVSGDDQVTLEIDVENTDFSANATPGAPPPTSTSAFKSMVRIRNDEMVVLGGLEKLEKSETGTGVPILSRIPIIKWLFSSRTKSKSKTKQLVFIRPTIIY